MKKVGFLLVAVVFLCTPFALQAQAFTLGNYVGPVKFKFSNFEEFILPPDLSSGPYFAEDGDGTEDNYGIFDVTTIITDDGTNTPLWQTGDNDEELTGVFYGIDIQSASLDVAGGINVQSVGGFFDIYLDDEDFTAADGTSGYFDTNSIAHDEYSTATDGVLFMRLIAVPGIDPLTDATLDGNFDSTTLPTTGDVAFYLSVVPNVGIYWQPFDYDYFPVTWTDNGGIVQTGFADFFAQSDFTPSSTSDWDLDSEDPIEGFHTPEPTTMLLLGTGLLGAGIFGRKRTLKKK